MYGATAAGGRSSQRSAAAPRQMPAASGSAAAAARRSEPGAARVVHSAPHRAAPGAILSAPCSAAPRAAPPRAARCVVHVFSGRERFVSTFASALISTPCHLRGHSASVGLHMDRRPALPPPASGLRRGVPLHRPQQRPYRQGGWGGVGLRRLPHGGRTGISRAWPSSLRGALLLVGAHAAAAAHRCLAVERVRRAPHPHPRRSDLLPPSQPPHPRRSDLLPPSQPPHPRRSDLLPPSQPPHPRRSDLLEILVDCEPPPPRDVLGCLITVGGPPPPQGMR